MHQSLYYLTLVCAITLVYSISFNEYVESFPTKFQTFVLKSLDEVEFDTPTIKKIVYSVAESPMSSINAFNTLLETFSNESTIISKHIGSVLYENRESFILLGNTNNPIYDHFAVLFNGTFGSYLETCGADQICIENYRNLLAHNVNGSTIFMNYFVNEEYMQDLDIVSNYMHQIKSQHTLKSIFNCFNGALQESFDILMDTHKDITVRRAKKFIKTFFDKFHEKLNEKSVLHRYLSKFTRSIANFLQFSSYKLKFLDIVDEFIRIRDLTVTELQNIRNL